MREYLCRQCMTLHQSEKVHGRLPHYCEQCRETVRRFQINLSGNKELMQAIQPVYDRWRWHEKQDDHGPRTKEQFLLEVFEMTTAVQRARAFITELRHGKR